jgi:putative solute:sodium symporter small subunit
MVAWTCANMRAAMKEHWRANLTAIGVLLAAWAVAGLGLGILLVEPLNAFRIAGYPLGFWFAQQGSIFVFILLIWIYARWMEAIDARHGGSREDER